MSYFQEMLTNPSMISQPSLSQMISLGCADLFSETVPLSSTERKNLNKNTPDLQRYLLKNSVQDLSHRAIRPSNEVSEPSRSHRRQDPKHRQKQISGKQLSLANEDSKNSKGAANTDTVNFQKLMQRYGLFFNADLRETLIRNEKPIQQYIEIHPSEVKKKSSEEHYFDFRVNDALARGIELFKVEESKRRLNKKKSNPNSLTSSQQLTKQCECCGRQTVKYHKCQHNLCDVKCPKAAAMRRNESKQQSVQRKRKGQNNIENESNIAPQSVVNYQSSSAGLDLSQQNQNNYSQSNPCSLFKLNPENSERLIRSIEELLVDVEANNFKYRIIQIKPEDRSGRENQEDFQEQESEDLQEPKEDSRRSSRLAFMERDRISEVESKSEISESRANLAEDKLKEGVYFGGSGEKDEEKHTNRDLGSIQEPNIGQSPKDEVPNENDSNQKSSRQIKGEEGPPQIDFGQDLQELGSMGIMKRSSFGLRLSKVNPKNNDALAEGSLEPRKDDEICDQGSGMGLFKDDQKEISESIEKMSNNNSLDEELEEIVTPKIKRPDRPNISRQRLYSKDLQDMDPIEESNPRVPPEIADYFQLASKREEDKRQDYQSASGKKSVQKQQKVHQKLVRRRLGVDDIVEKMKRQEQEQQYGKGLGQGKFHGMGHQILDQKEILHQHDSPPSLSENSEAEDADMQRKN